MTPVTVEEAIRRLRARRDAPPYGYKPEQFDFGLELLEEGAAFVVRRAGNGLWDEIVIQLAPKAGGAIQLPLAD